MSISVACPSCKTVLKVRDDLAGKRGKCPKCSAPVLIPDSNAASPVSHSVAATAGELPSGISADEILIALSKTLETLPPSAKQIGSSLSATLASAFCSSVLLFQIALPIVLSATVAYYYFFLSSGLSTSRPIIHWTVVGVGAALAVIAMLSMIGARPRRPATGIPLISAKAPLLLQISEKIATALEASPPKYEAVWDATLTQHRQTITLGMSSLASLPLADAIGLIARSIAIERGSSCRTIHREYRRLEAIVSPPPDEALTLGKRMVRWLGLLGRPISWILFSLVRLVSEPALRKNEFDADLVQAHLLGSQGFVMAIRRQRLVQYATEMVLADLMFQVQDNSLADDRPKVVERHIREMPSEVRQSILETEPEEPAKTDFVPLWQERFEAVMKSRQEPTLVLPGSAKLLIADFPAVCRDVTWIDCQRRFGDRFTRKDLKPA